MCSRADAVPIPTCWDGRTLVSVAASVRDRAVEGVVRACYSGGEDLDALRRRLLHALRRVVPFDAAFMAAADPDTLLFTSAFADDALVESGPLFLDNEFGARRDVNRFVDLAHAADPVASLDQVSRGQRATSARWREIMAPLGMGDELRVALRVDGTAWGFLCLHRSGATGFSASEMAVLRKVAPHAGEAIRRAATITRDAPTDATAEAVILVADHVVVAVGGAVDEIEPGGPLVVGGQLPVHLAAVVRRLEAIEGGDDHRDARPAAIRITARNGTLVAVHAARLRDATGNGPIVLTVAPAAPAERSALLLAAHGLTLGQRRVANLVLQGRTTSQVVVALGISAHTVQDHLKVVFDKIGVRSRRELVSALMHPTR
jgi:DNA-binding CsgD family transcriptional regulator